MAGSAFFMAIINNFFINTAEPQVLVTCMELTFSIQEGGSCIETFTFIIELLSFIATIATVGISYNAIVYARKEYLSHKKEEKANTLAKYNERYSTNEHLVVVVEYLWQIEEIKEYSEKNSLYKKSYKEISDFLDTESKDNPKSSFKIPTGHQKELFLRFFEEIQYSIEQGSLEKEQVKELFYHYARVANDMGEVFVNDFYHPCWRRFKTFIKTMENTF